MFDIHSFTDKVKKGFSATCFGEVYGNALGIIACIYSILTVRKTIFYLVINFHFSQNVHFRTIIQTLTACC